MASTAAEVCSWMTDESAELALQTALTGDLQSQMMIAEAHDEMDVSQWMFSLSAAFSAWKERLLVPVGACHSWTRSSWLSTIKPAPPSLISSRTEPFVNIWKSAGGMEARVLSERSLCWDGVIVLSTGVMTVAIGGGLSNGVMKSCSQ